MAIQTSGSTGGTQPSHGLNDALNAPGNTPPPGADTAAPKFYRMDQVVSQFSSGSQLCSEGTEYLVNVKKTLQDSSDPTRVVANMQQMSAPSGTYVFSEGNRSVVCMFAESQTTPTIPVQRYGELGTQYTEETNLPLSVLAHEAARTFNSEFPASQKVVDFGIITSDRYTADKNGNNLAATIRRILKASDRQVMSDFEKIDWQSVRWSIDTSSSVFENTMQRFGCQTRQRNDTGFVLKIQSRSEDGGIRGQGWSTPKVIAAISVFTEFARTGNAMSMGMGGMYGQPINARYIPVVRITDIVTELPMNFILPICIAFTAHLHIRNEYWREQFKLLSGNRPSLGLLYQDPTTNEFAKFDNLNSLNEFIRTVCMPPVLAIDVAEGRFSVPGLKDYKFATSDEMVAQRIVKGYADFFKVPMESFYSINANGVASNNPVWAMTKEWAGVITYKGEVVDSRYIDYLELVNETKDPRVAEALLSFGQNAQLRASCLREYCKDFQMLYENNVCFLTMSMITRICELVATRLNIANTTNSNNNLLLASTDLSGLSSQASMLFDTTSFGQQYGGGNSNYGNRNFSGFNYGAF